MTAPGFESAPDAYAFPLLVKHILHTPVATFPDRPIVYAEHFRYDYRGLADRVGRLASALTELGVGRGDVVAVMDWDSHRYLEAFFAVPMMGAVLHTVNIRLSPEQILYTVDHAEDAVILAHRDFVPVLAEIAPRFRRKARIVLLEDVPSDAPPGIAVDAHYETMLSAAAPGFDFPDFDENTIATTFYTTGTTGDPKGVFYSHRQLVLHTLGVMAGAAAGGGHGRFHRDDVYMPVTPMFHAHAWGMPFVATALGVKQVYPGRYVPENLLALHREHGVTFSHCVPTILHMMLNAPDSADFDLSRWKVVIGGSALPKGLAAAAMARGIDVFTGYGMSETGPVLTIAHLEQADLELGDSEQIDIRCRSGRPLPLVDLRVVDESMNECPRGAEHIGELVIRAPWLTQGYRKNGETSEELWRGGYLHTGDLSFVDEDGYLQITDRLKDVIKSGGEWISSLELETIVSQHPGVSEVAAIGIPDERWGERPVLLVVPRAALDTPLTREAICAHIAPHVERGEISKWAVPDRVEFVASIAKTSVGKLDKKHLRRQYAEGTDASGD